MPELKIETGVVSYKLSGAGEFEVSFNPTDAAFIERLYNAFSELDAKQDSYKLEQESVSGSREFFNLARERDKEMREILDGVFHQPVSENLFGNMNVYAMAGGIPLWCNLMFALLDEINAVMEREGSLTDSRLDKYIKKYRRKGK